MQAAQAKFPSPIVTEIAKVPVGLLFPTHLPNAAEILPNCSISALQVSKYTTAEDYHQQYLAKGGRNGNAQSPAKVNGHAADKCLICVELMILLISGVHGSHPLLWISTC